MGINKIIPYGKNMLLTILFLLFLLNSGFSQWLTIGNVSGMGNWPSIFTLDQNTIFIVGGVTGPVIWRSTNCGLNFTQLPTNGLPSSSSNRFLSCVWATDENTIYVGEGSTQGNGLVKNAKVYKTTNGGTNWITILSSGTNINGFINGIVFSRANPQVGVVNCDPNSTAEKFKMWKTYNGGTNWTLFEPNAPNSCGAQNSVFYIDDNFYGFGLNTANARVAFTTNGGQDFIFQTLSGAGGVTGFVSTVAFSHDKTNGLAGTSQTSTTVARTTDGGLNWFPQTIPCTIEGHCNIKWVPDLPVAYIIVSNSTQSECFKTTNNGDNWFQYDFPSGAINITHSDLLYNNLTDDETESYIFATNTSGTVYLLHESPMPVKLLSFNYNVSGRNNMLKWVTSDELNNMGFEIYRRCDTPLQTNWSKLGFVKGAGTSNNYNYYKFEDKDLNSGTYYYKLKQIDFNGNYEYFNLDDKVEISNPEKYYLSQNYPNPFNPSTKISYSVPQNGFVSLKVYDVTGKEISSLVNEFQISGFYDITFSSSNLSAGIYFYKLVLNNFTSVKKMIIIK